MATSLVEGAITVGAAPETVWAFLCDARRYPEWIPDTLAILSVSDEPLVAGSTYRERSRLLGPLSLPSDWRVVEFAPPRSQQHDGRMLGPMSITFEVAPDGEGARFAYRLSYDVPLGPAGRLLDSLAVRPRLRNGFRQAAENLRRLVEAGAGTTANA